MDQYSAHVRNEFDAPHTGVQGNRSPQQNFPQGAPVSNFPQNGSNAFFQDPKNPQKNSEIQVAEVTQHEGLVVKQGEYRPEYGPLMYSWFASKEKANVSYDTFTWKNGSIVEKERSVPNPPPHFSEFARTLGVTWNTLKRWKKNHTDFAEYYEACVDIIQEFIVDNGLTGAYSGQFGIFAAKNLTKMKDVSINKNENYDMKSVLDAIEKGVDPNDAHDI